MSVNEFNKFCLFLQHSCWCEYTFPRAALTVILWETGLCLAADQTHMFTASSVTCEDTASANHPHIHVRSDILGYRREY